MVEQKQSSIAEETRWGAVSAAVVATIAAATPGFTTGALTGPITAALGVSTAAFGLALACFFAFTALGSPFSARLAERVGAAPQLALSGVVAGAAMVGLGFTSSVAALALLLALSGLANSLVQPAAGRVLGADVAPGRLSLASGMVQGALGAAPLSAGLLVSLLADPYGWRTALFVGGALVVASAVVAVLARRREEGSASEAGGGSGKQAASLGIVGRRVLVFWVVGAALGTIGVNVTASFFVPIGTDSGFSAATAGLLATTAGALAAVVRVGSGAVADRRPQANLAAVVAMMLAGTVGLVVISLGTTATFLVGALLVVAGLWGWNGLLVASAIRLLPGSPARALGGLQIGFFSGATVAPLVFGSLSTALGVGGAVLAAAVGSLLAAGAVMTGELYRRSGTDGSPEGA